jgi:hypothetical protein
MDTEPLELHLLHVCTTLEGKAEFILSLPKGPSRTADEGRYRLG